jgi:hypothetical protein
MPRIGLYKSWVPSIDEGWTRWILEQYEFPYTSLDDAGVRKSGLRERFDVIVIPAEVSLDALVKGHAPDRMPAEYAGGIGVACVDNLKQFVTEGGTLLTLDSGGEVVLEHFGVPVRNVLKDVKEQEFFCPGSIVRLKVDVRHPLGYGVPAEVAAKFVRSPAYETTTAAPASPAVSPRVVASYPERPLLLSGLLIGEEKLAGRAAVIETTYGRGSIVMLGFRVQHRGQTHGTYKLLFNALYYGVARAQGQPSSGGK